MTGTPAIRHTATTVSMDTVVSVEVVTPEPEESVRAAMERALGWFPEVERICSRFDPASEVRHLTTKIGTPVRVSPALFEALRFALALAERTGGAFDPTVGRLLEARGFNRHYVTGERVASNVPSDEHVSYRDVHLNPRRSTVTLRHPLVLDLGAVAKGLAIDLAARELSGFASVCIDAGGDIFARGRNAAGQPWRIGVQDPRDPAAIVRVLEAANQAVCTSGDYERRGAGGEHHLVDPRSGAASRTLASVTVLAPTALAADGLATAAFILGPEDGRRLLEDEGVDGVFVTPAGDVLTTKNLKALPAY